MACLLTRVAGTFSDFEGPAGQKVTLKTRSHIGIVLIASATYGDAELIPPGTALDQVSLTVATGQKTLKIVAVFSASTMGRGELREVAGAGDQFLIDLPGKDPFQILRIAGKQP